MRVGRLYVPVPTSVLSRQIPTNRAAGIQPVENKDD